jgi:hypothetical protein
MEEMKTVYEQLGSDIEMISIDVLHDDTEENIQVYCNENGYEWIFARDTDELILKYSAAAIPKTCIIDTDGYISYSQEGQVDSETLMEEVEKASVTHEQGDILPLLLLIFLICAVVVVVLATAILKMVPSSGASESSGQDNGVGYPCPACGQSLVFIKEHQRWYCDNCRRYV